MRLTRNRLQTYRDQVLSHRKGFYNTVWWRAIELMWPHEDIYEELDHPEILQTPKVPGMFVESPKIPQEAFS